MNFRDLLVEIINNVTLIRPWKVYNTFLIENRSLENSPWTHWVLQDGKIYSRGAGSFLLVFDSNFDASLISILTELAKIKSQEYLTRCIEYIEANEKKLFEIERKDRNGAVIDIIEKVGIYLGLDRNQDWGRRGCWENFEDDIFAFTKKNINTPWANTLLAHAIHLIILLDDYEFEGCYDTHFGGEDSDCTWNAYDYRCSCGNTKNFVLNIDNMDWEFFTLDNKVVENFRVYRDTI